MEVEGCSRDYQIARQPVLPTPNQLAPDRLGDVLLLINGLPLIHIEFTRCTRPRPWSEIRFPETF